MTRVPISQISILASLLFALFAMASDPPTKEHEALMQSERDWANAWSNKDAKALDFEADEYTYTDYDGVVTDRAADAQLLKSSKFNLRYSVEDMKATVFDDAGVVIGRQTQKGNNDSRDISGVFRFTDTWIKRDGHWRCVASQITRIEKP